MTGVDAAVRWLARLQHPAGSWSDFLLAPGPSDGWVTAYAGTALAVAASDSRLAPRTRSLAARSADAAVHYLLNGQPSPPLLQPPPSRMVDQVLPGQVVPDRVVAGRVVPDRVVPDRVVPDRVVPDRVVPDRVVAGRVVPDRHPGVWGWTAAVHPDADSTAWAVRLLALRGWAVPERSLAFLAEHRDHHGYRTYRSRRSSGRWAAPAPEVTAAALLARHAAGDLDRAQLAAEWCALLPPARHADGAWHSLWWPDPAYPTAVVGAAWHAAGRPPFSAPVPSAAVLSSPVPSAPVFSAPVPSAPMDHLPARSVQMVHPHGAAGHGAAENEAPGHGAAGLAGERVDTAWWAATRLWAAAAFDPGRCDDLAAGLLATSRRDGGFCGSAELCVPPQHAGRPPQMTTDARGIFATATALHALLAWPAVPAVPAVPAHVAELDSSGLAAPSEPAAVEFGDRSEFGDRGGGGGIGGRGELGGCGDGRRIGDGDGGGGRRRAPDVAGRDRERYGAVVRGMAVAAGVEAGTALPVFGALTRESLARDGVWPARQLSNLAGGTPLEFSVGSAPALRLTAEVGDPLLAPQGRVASGLRAVGRAAGLLGMEAGWLAVQPAVAVLADPRLPVPDGCRFWLWAGLDLAAGGRAVLKAYLSLHAEDVPGWPAREAAFLAACGVPPRSQVYAVLDRLRADGWCHEAGVGLAGGDRWGVKIYYELAGYRPGAVRDVLALCGLDDDPVGLAPEVPGVLRASMAAKRRSGIAIRVHPGTGRVDEVTVAAAFPQPMVGRDELARRVGSWLAALGPADLPAEVGPTHRPAEVGPAHRPAAVGPASTSAPVALPHDAAVAVLRPGWRCAPGQARMHSLLTRSRSASGDETKVYLRPWPGGGRGCDGGHRR